MIKHKVLFISAPIGAGHIRAAQAVSESLRLRRPDVKTAVTNVFDFINPAIGRTVLKGYLKLLDIFPKVYGAVYCWANQSRLATGGREIISRYLAGRMAVYIDSYQPSVIVCTHATPAGLVAWLKKRGKITVPAVAIITDFVVHRLWVYPDFDWYYVAHASMADYLSQQGISRDVITVTGIPVSNAFTRPIDRRQVLNNLNLVENRKTVLIMGGGAGILPMDDILQLCGTMDSSLQIIVVAGNNHVLYQKLTRIALEMPHQVKVVGFVDNIHELMTAADILISKPGGMSAAEALAVGLPIIIYHPIPGQEAANTNYLLRSKAALRADSLAELKTILTRLLYDCPAEFGELRQQAISAGRPKAAADIAKFIANNYFGE